MIPTPGQHSDSARSGAGDLQPTASVLPGVLPGSAPSFHLRREVRAMPMDEGGYGGSREEDVAAVSGDAATPRQVEGLVFNYFNAARG